MNIPIDSLPYSWHDYTIQTTDLDEQHNILYRDTLSETNYNGCDSIAILHLHVRESCEMPFITIPTHHPK